jgi:hypothetical protein
LPGGCRRLREQGRGCAEDDSGEIDSHVHIMKQTVPVRRITNVDRVLPARLPSRARKEA